MSENQIGLFDAIYTQRAIRSFKPGPVPREAIIKIIEAGTKAPSGGNSQPWAFVVIQEAATRAKMAEYARHGFEALYAGALARMKPGDPAPMARLKLMIEAFEQIPCLIIACLVHPPGGSGNYGSIYPAVQNMLLAARGLGLGAALTSGWASRDMPQIKDLLGIPENVEPVVFMPLGYPDKERYGKTTRRPWSEVTHWEKWEGEKPNSAQAAHRLVAFPLSMHGEGDGAREAAREPAARPRVSGLSVG
jgi:nitroreductase